MWLHLPLPPPSFSIDLLCSRIVVAYAMRSWDLTGDGYFDSVFEISCTVTYELRFASLLSFYYYYLLLDSCD
jgi:hypothetical protein